MAMVKNFSLTPGGRPCTKEEFSKLLEGYDILSEDLYMINSRMVLDGNVLDEKDSITLAVDLAYAIPKEDLPRAINSKVAIISCICKKRLETE
jgi:hypothetical protein